MRISSLIGVDYTIPFGRVASILLERTGDLGPGHAGLLIFVDRAQRPEYVPWTEVEQIDFHSPPGGPSKPGS